MLTEISPGVVRSSEGYEVRDLGPIYLTYVQDDGRVARFFKEDCIPKPIYYIREVKWGAPYETESVPPMLAATIQRRIIEALMFQKSEFQTDLDEVQITFKVTGKHSVTASNGCTVELRDNQIEYFDHSNRILIPCQRGDKHAGPHAIVIPSSVHVEYFALATISRALALLGYQPLVMGRVMWRNEL